MKSKPTQEELQAATNATLRAHATSDEAKALVARLAAMVDQHAHAAEALHWPNINARITLRSKQKMEAVS